MPIELASSPSPDPCPQTVPSSSQLVPDASDGLSPDVATPPQDNEVVGRKRNPKYLQPSAKKGRRKDPVWDDVIVADDIVSCKKCEKIIHQLGKTHVERVRDHFKSKYPKRPVSKTITACFPPALGPVKIAAFQRQFALWFYSTGMAFNKVNHATLVKALAVLNPGAVLPTARELATTLLNSSYGELKLVMVHRVKGKKSTLVTDSWTDVNGKSVINYVLICGDDTYLLETVYTGSTSHSASYLTTDIKRVIEVTKFASIAAVVTDNTATNQLVWQTLQADYPKVFFHGCISHVLHLVVKDLVARLPWLKKLEENCRKLVRFFKKHQQLWAELRRLQLLEGMNALVLPADTRWGTIKKCFVSVLESESILHAFVSGRDFLKAKNKEQKAKRRMAYDIVRATDFVPQLEKGVALLEVLSNFQKVFERNTRPISDVYNMFLQLPKKFDKISMPITEFAVITIVLRERFDFVDGDAHGVSYLLDPRYAGKDMDNDAREAVVDFIAKWNGPGAEDATMIELMKFQTAVEQETRPIKLVLDKRIGVREFWSGVHGYPQLQNVANVVFASACSSAAAERNCSAHKFVHSQIRNRLKESNVEKLVFIYFNMKNLQPEDLDLLNLIEDVLETDTEASNNQDSNFEYY